MESIGKCTVLYVSNDDLNAFDGILKASEQTLYIDLSDPEDELPDDQYLAQLDNNCKVTRVDDRTFEIEVNNALDEKLSFAFQIIIEE